MPNPYDDEFPTLTSDQEHDLEILYDWLIRHLAKGNLMAPEGIRQTLAEKIASPNYNRANGFTLLIIGDLYNIPPASQFDNN